jgi:hypothetical protein
VVFRTLVKVFFDVKPEWHYQLIRKPYENQNNFYGGESVQPVLLKYINRTCRVYRGGFPDLSGNRKPPDSQQTLDKNILKM